MSVYNLKFSAQINNWTDATSEKITEVFHESSVTVVDRMQKIGPSSSYPTGQGGNMPVDTGWLRASIRASLLIMPTIDKESFPPEGAGPKSIPYNSDTIDNVIYSANLGETIYIGYTAAYAPNQEEIRAFTRLAAMMWTSIVNGAVSRAKGK